MNSEKILDAMEFLDDDLLLEADALRTAPKKKNLIWIKALPLVACLVLAVIGAYHFVDMSIEPESNNIGEEEVADGNYAANDMADAVTQDKFGTATDNYEEFRDEAVVGQSSGSTTNGSYTYSPLYVEITEFTNEGFKGTVITNNGTFFADNQAINVVYNDDMNLVGSGYKVGDKVYVIYSIKETDTSTIYISSIAYEEDLL